MLFRLLLLAGLLALPLLPQGADAVLTGSVTDPTGAAVPGARVAAENVLTGVVARTQSNESGIYVFPLAAAGKLPDHGGERGLPPPGV